MCDFNPRSPCGERLGMGLSTLTGAVFQSMLPVRGATHGHSHRQGLIHISIHAPRAGSDSGIVTEMLLILDFNPCSPCGERQTWAAHRPRHKDFNPCSPCGERPAKAKKLFESGMKISIHAPRAGSDDPGPLKASWIQYFNPCSPCGERRHQFPNCR